MSAYSSSDIPTAPLTSDDDELNLSPQLRKVHAAQLVRIHPLVISKTAPPNASSATATLEFTLADAE